MVRQKPPLKLSLSVILMVTSVVISVLLVVHTLFFRQISLLAENNIRDKTFAIARTLALNPVLVNGLTAKSDPGAIQRLAQVVNKQEDLLFVVITDMHGIRYAHPTASLIGKHFIGDDILPALKGRENSAINQGTLAKALRVFTPVYDSGHQQIGVVAIGTSLVTVQAIINHNRWNLLWTALIGAAVGVLGTGLLVRALKRIMLGFEPYEISHLFEERNAMLQSIKEGVIAVDADTRITLINDEAKRLFNQHPPGGQRPDTTVEPPSLTPATLNDTLQIGTHAEDPQGREWLASLHLGDVMQRGIARRDEEIRINGGVMLSNTVPVLVNGQIIGAIATFRDKTEVSRLLERLSGMSTYADALRVQSHEFMNKLHVILGMLHLKNYRELEGYILKTANNYQHEIGLIIRIIKSPVIAGFILGKINRARDVNIPLRLTEDSWLPDTDNGETTTAIITVLGNLIENAMEALAGQESAEITLSLHVRNDMLHCTVSDDGPGIPESLQEKIYQRGFSTKGNGRGIGLFLARQSVEKLGGWLEYESEPGVYTQFYVTFPYRVKAG
ncbi:sensor histidine kinase [Acerihabitans sp. TG2]|uniref:sensor histidine kinase n=1 Tax=Acerihabitans sp. TG2 TaxID=3096008 RepID=UPI002B2303F4|nr:sensor histidine kinase [Acerihabitans sp. TG2]MEA9391300.1 sensor histidine kinase [Acerihabitans sp. TG2]